MQRALSDSTSNRRMKRKNDSITESCLKTKIHRLPDRALKIIESKGEYFDRTLCCISLFFFPLKLLVSLKNLEIIHSYT